MAWSKAKWREHHANHERLRRVRGSAKAHACVSCDAPAREWAQIHELDGTDPSHYQPMCITCHRRYDRESYLGHAKSLEARAKIGAANKIALIGNKNASGKRTPEQIARSVNAKRAAREAREAALSASD